MAQLLEDTHSPTKAILSDNQLNNSLPSPAGSFVSKESYSTAISSPTHVDLEIHPITKSTPDTNSSSLILPQNLRKSISVDSFVHYGRETLSPVVTRPNRGHTGSALEPPTGLVGLRREFNHVNQPGRSRGDSISSVKSSLAEDSDADRSDTYNSSTERYRQTLKPQDHVRSFVPGGELPLPSRTPTLSTTSSMSSIMSSTTSSSTQEATPSLRSASSLQSPARPIASAGRTRSGSLGVYSQNTRRIQINTQIASVSIYKFAVSFFPCILQEQNQAITLAVVGTAGCGKSVAVRKGLKNNNLSDPSGPLPGPHPSIRRMNFSCIYICRALNSQQIHEVPELSLEMKGSSVHYML